MANLVYPIFTPWRILNDVTKVLFNRIWSETKAEIADVKNEMSAIKVLLRQAIATRWST